VNPISENGFHDAFDIGYANQDLLLDEHCSVSLQKAILASAKSLLALDQFIILYSTDHIMHIQILTLN